MMRINAANIGITNLHYYAPGNALSLDRTYNSLYTTPVDKNFLKWKTRVHSRLRGYKI